MIKVYAFKIWDEYTGAYVYCESKATIEAIGAAKGFPLDGSEENISKARVDERGICRPEAG